MKLKALVRTLLILIGIYSNPVICSMLCGQDTLIIEATHSNQNESSFSVFGDHADSVIAKIRSRSGKVREHKYGYTFRRIYVEGFDKQLTIRVYTGIHSINQCPKTFRPMSPGALWEFTPAENEVRGVNMYFLHGNRNLINSKPKEKLAILFIEQLLSSYNP